MKPMFKLSSRFSSCLLFFAILCLAATAMPALAETPAPEGEPSRYFANRMQEMREHVQRIVGAVPAMPEELRRVAATFQTSAAESGGAGQVALGVLICLLAGAAVEWAIRRATNGMRIRHRGVSIRSTADRLAHIGIDALLE